MGLRRRKLDEIIKETDLKKGKKITESFISNTKNYIENKYKKGGLFQCQGEYCYRRGHLGNQCRKHGGEYKERR